MSDKFYLTTTLPYVNALPHIGHTSEFIKADVIARFQRYKRGKDNVWFNVGTDEHGLKNYQKARELGKETREYVDELADGWKEFCKLFGISYNTFYRTSEEYHKVPAQAFWEISNRNGDIYKKEYKGWYCVGCEEFKTEKDIIEADENGANGKCSIHKKSLQWVEEENYFFKLSKYREDLLIWLDNNKDVLKPAKRFDELRNWVSEMEDISVSRSKENLKWGIDVPGDDSQVMYVWFDALTNYINVLGFGGTEEQIQQQNEWWPGVQIFGVDNLRFQGAIWQGMLASVGEQHTGKLLCNGFILAEDGTKMSKTIGNVVSPFDQEEKFGAEAVRFYIIAGIPTYNDSPYKEDELINLYNSHLANNFGNLLNRVIHLANKLEVEINREDTVDEEFKAKVVTIKSQVEDLFEEYELQQAAQSINELATFGNEYITENEPWSKDKSTEEVQIILNNLSYLLKVVAELYSFIIPDSSAKALEKLQNREAGALFEKLETNE